MKSHGLTAGIALSGAGPTTPARSWNTHSARGRPTNSSTVAVNKLKGDGYEWAPSQSRMQPEPDENSLITAKRMLANVLSRCERDGKGVIVAKAAKPTGFVGTLVI